MTGVTGEDTLLLAVNQDYSVQIGLPPQHIEDSFKERASFLGNINKISHLACSPNGELFCIRDRDLYRGPMPSKKDVDWFTLARRVGRFHWNKAKCILFHPNGDFIVVTYDGEMYKGPQPDNEHVPWLYTRAKRIGDRGWNLYNILFFDTEGLLYGVIHDQFLNGPLPTEVNASWTQTLLGGSDWERLSYFMGYTPDKQLWTVDLYNGNLFRGDTPTAQKLGYMGYADYLGWNYNEYRFLAFTKDRTIKNIISFEFLTDQGEKTSETPEVLEEKIYDNRKSSSILRHTFMINKTIKESSRFSHEHGFTFETGCETSFEGGVPFVSKANMTVRMNTSTTHNWNLEKTNETEMTVETSTDIELEPGKAIRMVASVIKAQITVPYKAKARTMFGSVVEVHGKWFGVSHYNLMVTQEDFDK